MKTFHKLALASGLLLTVLGIGAHGATTIVADNYTVTGAGSGFALNTGINSGINPPTTRLTGTAASGLRYFNTGTKATTAYTITSNKARITAAVNPGRYVLSANGTASFDFASALGTGAAKPGNPVVYDLSISIDNDSTGTLRTSFALGTVEGDAFSWAFGFQVYRVASGNNFYTIGKRIDTASSGLGADLNAAILTMGASTYGTEITILMRVTDAGSETSAFNSRVQLSTNGGSSWFYDTQTDPNLTSGFRLNGAGRHIMWDVAPDAGNVTYDNFSVNWISGPRMWTGAGANGNWNNSTNWGGAVPANGDKLIFSGTTRQTNTNNLSGLSLPWLSFNNGGFALYGNALTVSSAITNVTGSSTVNNAITAGGTLRFQSDAGTLTLAGNITGGAQNLIVDGVGNTTASGAITGTGGLTKGGPGTLTLSGTSANTLSGNSIVNTGIISLAKTAGVNALAGNMTIGDGVGGAGVDIVRLAAANQISDSAAVTVSASGSLDLNGFAETVASVSGSSASSQITLGSGTLTVGNGSAITFAGIISGTGNIVKQGASALTLSGANTFSGTATVSAGALNVQNATALGGAGATVVSGGTALEVQGGITISGEPLTLNGSGISSAGALRNVSGNNSWSGAVTLGSAARVNSDSGILTVSGDVNGGQNLTVGGAGNTTASGIISGAGSLTKDGAGVLQLSGSSANTFSGGTIVNAGTLSLAKTAGVDAVAGNITIGDGAGTDVVQLGAANQISDSATVTISTGGSLDLNGFSETVASVSSSSASSQIALGAGTLTVGNGSAITFAGSISGAGNIVKQGASTLTLSGGSTFIGTATINTGALNVQNATALGGAGATVVSSGTALEIQGSLAISGEPLTLNGSGISSAGALRNISGNNSWSGAVTLGSASRIHSDSGTLTISGGVGGGQSLTVAGAGNTTVSGVIASGSVTKESNGTLTLSGANTYAGNTTISAGTLALGTGGSISSSPSITIANGTTLDVSAISYSVGASQTLVRNSTSGSGSVNGSITLSSGATVSLQADGTGATVGSLSVTGNLTLNGNTLAINVTGSALGASTNTLITYTGSKSGSFNTNATITGSGIAAGKASRIVETTGQISLEVYTPGIPAHGVAAASIKVVENDLANTTNSVTVTTTMSINGLQVRDGSSRGDYTVQVGASGTDDVAGGALITCVAENGKDHGEDSGINYCSSAISLNSGGYFIPTTTAEDGSEYNINVAAAYFAYNKYLGGYARNSGGTNGGANNLLTSSSGIVLGTHFVDNGGGVSTVNLTSLGIDSQTDGVLLVTAGANDNHYASSIANANGTWSIYAKDNTTDGAVYDQAPVAFAFVPKSNIAVISGKFIGDGSITMFNGDTARFSVTEVTNGTWQLTIPGYAPSKGVLVISAEGGNGANADNIVSYQPSGNNWIIHSRDLPGQGLQALTTQPVVSFVFIPAPSVTLVSPANNANVSSSPTLTVSVTNNNPGNLTVMFHGHRLPKPGPGEDFMIAVLPDTQNYAREASGSGNAVKEMWFAQTDWIVNNRVSENIAYVATLGDCVQNGNDTSEWKNATNAYYRLEKQSTTDLLDGIPYGVTVGNHDQEPAGEPDGSTSMYNQYFGISHWDEKDYYGGHYHTNNDNWVNLFSAGEMDFLVISFEYGRYGTLVFDWAQSVIDAHPTRRIIVLTHHAGSDYHPSQLSNQGDAIYQALKVNPNFFLMMSGHVFNGDGNGEGHRTNTFNGDKVYTLVSDYQGRFNGGNGLMRLMNFSPSNNLISIKTYSPWNDTYETDFNSQFTLPYNMQPNGVGVAGTSYAPIKTNVNVVPGAQTSFAWTGLTASRTYEWYVTVTDSVGDYATSVEWKFNTTSGFVPDENPNNSYEIWAAKHGITDANADNDGDGQNNLAEFAAKTNPTDATSLLRILDVNCDANGQATLIWSSVGGVRYRIQYADGIDGEFVDLEREAASEMDSNALGAASTQSFTDSVISTNTVRFYRVKVVP